MSSPREQAARWFSRLQGCQGTHPQQAEFEAWLAGDPQHAREYQAFCELWGDFASRQRTEALAGVMEQRQARRKRLLQGTLCSLLLLVASAIGLHLYRHSPCELQLHTRIGERLEMDLRDGSELQLNGDTHLQLHFDARQRRVELLRGEASFDVAHDSTRPFVIEAGLARVTVLGTRFVVDRLGERLRVSVARGRVQVDGAAGQQAQIQTGEVLQVDKNGHLQRLAIPASNAFAFENGQLIFEQADLAEIAASLSRHRQQPVHAADQSGGPRISAVVQLGDLETFLQALPSIAAVRLEQQPQATLLHPGK